MEKAIYRITSGNGDYPIDDIYGNNTGLFTYEDACHIAMEETGVKAVVLAITVKRDYLTIPVAVAFDGWTYPIATITCPRCEGEAIVIVGWSPDAYENIEDDCPDCKGTGILSSEELRQIAEAAPESAN
jgi:hypothetical protein